LKSGGLAVGKTDIDVTITIIIVIIYIFLCGILYGERQANEFSKFLEENGLDGNKYSFDPRKLLRFLWIKEKKSGRNIEKWFLKFGSILPLE
jgi:hypothetical protein